MEINSVVFKDSSSFEKNKNKENVLEVHEPFGILVFEDKEPVAVNPSKVSHVQKVDASLDQLTSSLAICITTDLERAEKVLEEKNYKVKEKYPLTGTLFVVLPEMTSFEVVYRDLMSTQAFISVEPDYIIKADQTTFADAYSYASQWHLVNINAQEAWSLLPESSTKEVAVLDIALETTHEDLQGAISDLSWNCVFDIPNVQPITQFEKHGTPCTGLIAARTGNGIGVSSVGGNRLKVQFLHIGYNSTSFGSFGTSDTIITRALNRAIENPNCAAVSMSWSANNTWPLFSNALNIARSAARGGKGIPLFASSGNISSNDFKNMPAVHPSVMAVGASSFNNTKAPFSSFGPKLFAVAPGVSCPTLDRSGTAGYNSTSNYANFSGTSASCPIMAGIAAAVLTCREDLTESQVREVLKLSSRKLGGYTYDQEGKSLELGYGIVDMYAAVTLANSILPEDPIVAPPLENNIYGVVSSPSSAVEGSTVQVNMTLLSQEEAKEDITVQVDLYFERPDKTKFNIHNTSLLIKKGTTQVSHVHSYTIPMGISGPGTFIMVIDPKNRLEETNEEDNLAFTGINVTQKPAPVEGVDLEVGITGYKWLDDKRCQISFGYTNRGNVTITGYKVLAGFEGQRTSTWNRTDRLLPGKSSMGTAVFQSGFGTLPNIFKLQITQVNGAVDLNEENNSSSILVTK